MPVNISSAKDKAGLFATLQSIDISVPLRTERRTTEHTETWSICRLLSTLAESNLVTYPVTVRHRDRPDFYAQFGDTEIGIEITEAVSEKYAAFSAIAEREFPEAFLEPGHFRWDSPDFTLDDMRSLLRQERLSATPWVGDRAEQEWALYIQSVIKSKLGKLTKPGFSHFPNNWLCIYDNLPLCHINLERALAFLQPALVEIWSRSHKFNAILIEHGPVIVALTCSNVRHLVLCDLW